MSAHHPTRKEVQQQVDQLPPEDQVRIAKAILSKFNDPAKFRKMSDTARRGIVKILQGLQTTVTSALLERQQQIKAVPVSPGSNEPDPPAQGPPKLHVVRDAVLHLVRSEPDDDGPGAA